MLCNPGFDLLDNVFFLIGHGDLGSVEHVIVAGEGMLGGVAVYVE